MASIYERVGLRMPGVARRANAAVLGMKPGSRTRRRALRWAAQRAFEAWNSGDFRAVEFLDAGEVETHVTQGSSVVLGLDSVYYGKEGHCHAMEVWNEAWSSWDAEIDEIVEVGSNRFVIVARIQAVGASSGVTLDEWGAVSYTFRDGLIVRVDGAFDSSRERVLDAIRAEARAG